MSSIGSISYVNQNQIVAVDNIAKMQAKVFADGDILPDAPEVAVIEESSESAKTNTNFDEEKNYSQEQNSKKEKENKKQSELFGIIIEDSEEEETPVVSDKIFDKLV